MKLTSGYYTIEEFWNLQDGEFCQVLDCLKSDINALILMKVMEMEEELGQLYELYRWQILRKR